MRRSVLAFSGLALFGAALTACSVNRFERREPWRDQAEQVCLAKKLVTQTEFITPAAAIDGPGPCGMQQPFRVTRLGNGSVLLKQRMTLGCPALAEAEAWLADTIQPAAELYFGVAVAEINAGTYSCRGRNNQPGAKLSEHGFGNAVDVMSFKLADGHVITVKGGWRGTEASRASCARCSWARASASPRCSHRARTCSTTTTSTWTSPGTTRAACAGSASRSSSSRRSSAATARVRSRSPSRRRASPRRRRPLWISRRTIPTASRRCRRPRARRRSPAPCARPGAGALGLHLGAAAPEPRPPPGPARRGRAGGAGRGVRRAAATRGAPALRRGPDLLIRRARPIPD